MKKSNKITTKIKILGALLIFLMLSVITTTIYLNQQNSKDALVINIAGKCHNIGECHKISQACVMN